MRKIRNNNFLTFKDRCHDLLALPLITPLLNRVKMNYAKHLRQRSFSCKVIVRIQRHMLDQQHYLDH